MSHAHHVTVLGGGISGLTAAWFLARNAPKSLGIALVHEGSEEHAGGWLQSQRTAQGHLFELGARSINAKPENVEPFLELVHGLDLASQLIAVPKQTSPVQKNRYILHEGAVRAIPTSPLGLLRDPLTRPVVRGIWRDLMRSRGASERDGEDESVHAFFSRRLDKDISENLVSAFVNGVYGGNVRQWSIRSLFPQLWSLGRSHRSIVLGAVRSSLGGSAASADRQQVLQRLANFPERSLVDRWNSGAFLSFHDGLQTLPRAIYEELKHCENVKIYSSTRCTSLTKSLTAVECSLQSTASNGAVANRRLETDRVISAIPAYSLYALLEPSEADYEEARDLLASIPFESLASVNMAWDEQIPVPLEPSLGYLVPSKEVVPEVGVVFDTFPFPQRQPHRSTVLTVLLGGHQFSAAMGGAKLHEQTPEQLYQLARQVLQRRLGIQSEPMEYHVALHRNCIPQYSVGHDERVSRLRQVLDKSFSGRLQLTGASYCGIGIPDCIQQSWTVAQQVQKDLNTAKVEVEEKAAA